MKVLVLNGPNLGRLGRRQPEIYGSTTHAELAHQCVLWGRDLGLSVEVRQTNHEGALLDWLSAPLVEVHISDPKARPEEFRRVSVVEPHAVATIAGEGIDGYRQALGILAATVE